MWCTSLKEYQRHHSQPSVTHGAGIPFLPSPLSHWLISQVFLTSKAPVTQPDTGKGQKARSGFPLVSNSGKTGSRLTLKSWAKMRPCWKMQMLFTMIFIFTTKQICICPCSFHGNHIVNWVDFLFFFLCLFALRKLGNEFSVIMAAVPLPVLSTTHPYQTLKKGPCEHLPTWSTRRALPSSRVFYSI